MTGRAAARGSDGLHAEASALVDMLVEQSPRYAGRGSNEVERLRGDVLACFETTGLPAAAIPFVLEELETGRDPYTVAAAGRALRGAATIPTEAPELLVTAIARLRGTDDLVSFETPASASGDPHPTTALVDLATTLALLGPRAKVAIPALNALVDSEGESFSAAVRTELVRARKVLARTDDPVDGCCCRESDADVAAPRNGAAPAGAVRTELGSVELEDQDGTRVTFSDAFSGRPTALAFFYTRCMNPEKCSLTVTQLARLARRLVDDGVDANVAGISYDPRFDRPARLRTYGADRGMVFSPRCSLLRTIGPFDPLREAFALGVGFGPVTVNRHRLDLVVLDASLDIVDTFERRLWHEDTVYEALRVAAAPGAYDDGEAVPAGMSQL
ncbi:MAG TPA: SCO family protein [Ilumatobacteraceae bacterium]|nr:SCO family protein [Ilumatobacteraceae bacterium]